MLQYDLANFPVAPGGASGKHKSAIEKAKQLLEDKPFEVIPLEDMNMVRCSNNCLISIKISISATRMHAHTHTRARTHAHTHTQHNTQGVFFYIYMTGTPVASERDGSCKAGYESWRDIIGYL